MLPFGSRSDPFTPSPKAAARYLFWLPAGLSLWGKPGGLGLSRLGAKPLLRRRFVAFAVGSIQGATGAEPPFEPARFGFVGFL